MKQTRGKVPVFTVADHLKVQMQIEQRAYALWLAEGSHQDTALGNWLDAEREVLEKFIQAYKNGRRGKRHQQRFGHNVPRSRVRSVARRTRGGAGSRVADWQSATQQTWQSTWQSALQVSDTSSDL